MIIDFTMFFIGAYLGIIVSAISSYFIYEVNFKKKRKKSNKIVSNTKYW